MQLKALSCREEAIYEHDPETLPSPLGQSLFKMDSKWKTVLWSDGSKPNVHFRKSSRLKTRGTIWLQLLQQRGFGVEESRFQYLQILLLYYFILYYKFNEEENHLSCNTITQTCFRRVVKFLKGLMDFLTLVY